MRLALREPRTGAYTPLPAGTRNPKHEARPRHNDWSNRARRIRRACIPMSPLDPRHVPRPARRRADERVRPTPDRRDTAADTTDIGTVRATGIRSVSAKGHTTADSGTPRLGAHLKALRLRLPCTMLRECGSRRLRTHRWSHPYPLPTCDAALLRSVGSRRRRLPRVVGGCLDISAYDPLARGEHGSIIEIVAIKESHHARDRPHVGHQQIPLGDYMFLFDIGVEVTRGVVAKARSATSRMRATRSSAVGFMPRG